MKIKRIIIPTITMVIIASQLMGCSAASQSELLQMINNGDQIEIEVATPINEEQGIEAKVTWIILEQLDNYSSFRKSFEDALKITSYADGSKNGIVYVGLDGNQNGNNTLQNAFMNRKFISRYWEDEKVQQQVQDAVGALYVDIEVGSEDMVYAPLNAYWNLLPDNEANYFNGGSTLTRGEAMALLMRASTPVTDTCTPNPNSSFTEAVGQNDYTDYASYLSSDSYLEISSKSLDNKTFNSTITRGEYIYMLIHNIFGAGAIESADTTIQLKDVKNGGDIAGEQKFIEDATTKDHWQSYELAYAMQNPENGCPERMYKGLSVANQLGIIGTETRWDEGLTKTEAIELLVKAYEAYVKENGYLIDAESGKGSGVVTDEEAPTQGVEATETEIEVNSTSDSITLEDDEYKGDNPLDTGYEGEDLIDVDDEAIVDEVMEQLKKEHPEWFEDSNTTNNSVTPAPYTGPALGTPSSGTTTDDFVFGQGDYSNGVGGTVY